MEVVRVGRDVTVGTAVGAGAPVDVGKGTGVVWLPGPAPVTAGMATKRAVSASLAYDDAKIVLAL